MLAPSFLTIVSVTDFLGLIRLLDGCDNWCICGTFFLFWFNFILLLYLPFVFFSCVLTYRSYTGFSEVMACLAKIGFFDTEVHPLLKGGKRPTFRAFLSELLEDRSLNSGTTGIVEGSITNEKEMLRRVTMLGCCKEITTAKKTVDTIKLNTAVPLYL